MTTTIITGASDGIGAVAARRLLELGHEVVITGRSPRKTEAVAKQLGIDFFVADFADLSQVRTLADELLARCTRIDVLCNNAGGVLGKRTETVDGHETTFQVNHLAPYLLTRLLLDRLVESRARVLNTSSIANRVFGKLDLDDLDGRTSWSSTQAYGNGKLENILFTQELQARYGQRGITTAAFHPGNVASNFSSEGPWFFRALYGTPLKRFALITPEKGADNMVWLATSEGWESGAYYVKQRKGAMNKAAKDPQNARRLWEISAEMVGLNTSG